MARNGVFVRKSDSKTIERWRCTQCGKTKSQATGTACFGQNKRRINAPLRALLSSGVSQRRAAKILSVHRSTVARKKKFLAIQARLKTNYKLSHIPKKSLNELQFDEMETFEHTKMKPLSIAVIVCPKTRQILGAKVSSMPARGPTAKKSVKKYGKRTDQRKEKMIEALSAIKEFTSDHAELTSDKKTSYPGWLRQVNPSWSHTRVKGRKPCAVGQGELKEGGFDPLFYLNHTCAMIRDSVKRLARRNWCTTKQAERLQDHLDIYREYHNSELVA